MEEECSLSKKYQITWEGLIRNADKPEKQERLKTYFQALSKFLHNEIKLKNKNVEIPDEDSLLIFMEKNKVLSTIASYITML